VQLVKAAPSAYPASANLTTTDLVVHVDVTVEPDGTVKSVRITRSSGTTDADKAALDAARAGTYRPATHLCAKVEGHFDSITTFVAPVMKSGLPPSGR
jgi:TonB family protein